MAAGCAVRVKNDRLHCNVTSCFAIINNVLLHYLKVIMNNVYFNRRKLWNNSKLHYCNNDFEMTRGTITLNMFVYVYVSIRWTRWQPLKYPILSRDIFYEPSAQDRWLEFRISAKKFAIVQYNNLKCTNLHYRDRRKAQFMYDSCCHYQHIVSNSCCGSSIIVCLTVFHGYCAYLTIGLFILCL